MFIFLFYLLFNIRPTFSTIVVQNSGLYQIRNDDIGMILFLTVENTFDVKMPVSVYGLDCTEEGDVYFQNHMDLIGGDMGYIPKKGTKNLTLIYPNLYLHNRIGKCLIGLRFETDQTVEEVRKEIYFDSTGVFVHDTEEPQLSAVDCVVKYNSKRSYFNKERQVCEPVPECPPNSVYLPRSNVCRKLHEPVCESDLELIEDGSFEKCHMITNLVNYECHQGVKNNRTGECLCEEGWFTSTCREAAYHPTLNLYHMCNVELNTWGRANSEKILMTVLVLVILALAVAAKMLLAVCILNWCCRFVRPKSKEDLDEDSCAAYTCPYNYCGEEECPAGKRSSKTIRVSFSNIDAVNGENDTDVTVSIDDSREGSVVCHCK